MKCPRCDYASPYELVSCPQCQSVYAAAGLEELGHVDYLRDRLRMWCAEDKLPSELADRLLAEIGDHAVDLETWLGLREARLPAPVATAPITPPMPIAPVLEAPPLPAAVAPAAELLPAAAAVLPPVEVAALAAPPEVVLPAERPELVATAAPTEPSMPALTEQPILPPAPDLQAPAAAGREAAPRPTGPAFSWAQVGTYLLSERTLNALLGLGAFLILASGVVISTVNPTRLGPLPHLGAVAATMIASYAAGYVVRQKARLMTAGAALLAIGAAFVPLTVWTIGQERLLSWEPGAVWLVASLVCLPLYLGSHAVIRDRTFAVLTALAGGSELLAVLNWLRVPLEWGLCALLVLALGYILVGRRLQADWSTLAWALFWAAQVATPFVMAGLMVAKFFPPVWEAVVGRPPGGLFEYSVGGAWWLGTAFYALSARLFHARRYEFLAAWTLPFAVLFSLTKAPWDAVWYNVCLAALAVAYLIYGRWCQRLLVEETQPKLTAVLGQPAYQVGIALTVIAALWPFQSLDSRIPTLYAVVGTYALATYLFRHVAFRYAAAYLLPVAVAFTLEWLGQLGLAPFAPTWHGLTFALLALGYLVYGRFVLRMGRTEGANATWTGIAAEPMYQAAWLLTLVAMSWPLQTLDSRIATLYVAAGTYALAAYVFRHVAFRYAVAYLLPVAVAFTLERLGQLGLAPFAPAWHGLAFALLALGYLLYGRFVLRAGSRPAAPGAYAAVAREPVYQIAVLLTLGAALWPFQTLESGTAALYTISVVYGVAAFLLAQRAWAYVAVYLLPLAFGQTLRLLGLDDGARALAWAGLSAALLAAAEIAALRVGETRQPMARRMLGLGAGDSRFATPLFSAAYAVSLLTLGASLAHYWNAPASAGVRQLGTPLILAFLAIVAIYGVSALTRRTSFFLYPAAWLFLIPFTSGASLLFGRLEIPLPEHSVARLLAALGVGYLALAYLTDRAGGHYAKPLYLVGYCLSLATMLLSALDRIANVQVVGLSILVYAGSAWLVHRGRHPSYLWLLDRLCGQPDSLAFRTARALFLYLATWLFPVWLLLALSLREPPPDVAHYGLVLALLAPVYAALGLAFRAVRAEYRLPWYLAGYALSAIGPLVATPDPTLRTVALAVSIGLYVASTVVSRQSTWLYLVALLVPVWLWQVLERLDTPDRYYGLGLVMLGLIYGGLGMMLHHGHPRRLLQPIREVVGAYALPFFIVGFGLSALGLAIVANQARELVVLGFALGTLHYAGAALVFRQSLISYPLAATAAVAYVVGMTLTPLPSSYYGLGLWPGIAAYLVVAEVLRRRLDTADRIIPPTRWTAVRPDAWAAPFYLAVYAGSLAVPLYSQTQQGAWALAWWGLAALYAASVALWRHPAWLYPTATTGVVAYLATAYYFVPTLALPDAMATLAVPTWLLCWLAYAVDRRAPAVGPSFWPLLGAGRVLRQRWAAPLLVSGAAVLALSALGSIGDAGAGLRTALAYVVLLGALASLWRGEAEAGASLVFAAAALQQWFRLTDVPPLQQSPRWAVAALGATVLALAVQRLHWDYLAPWRRPLSWGSGAAGVVAIAAALAAQLALWNDEALRSLAVAVAVSGLSLVAHGFNRRNRWLAYLGVALLEIGFMLHLVVFDVGQPQFFVIPAGLYLLSVAYQEWRRGTPAGIKVPLEIVGLTVLLVTSLLQAIGLLGAGTERYTYATFLLLESVAIFGLGVALHWRRTFFAGILALLLDVGILLADPIRAMNTWYLVALIGIVMIALVVFVEQRRKQIPFWIDEWRLRLETWD
jgi:hypothetical protein